MEESNCGEWKPVFAMVAVDVAFAIVNILLKRVLDEGISHLVLVTYRQAIAAVFIAPIAYFRERYNKPWSIDYQFPYCSICYCTKPTQWMHETVC